MDALSLMTVKAAALRKEATREFETGLGVPSWKGPSDARPLTAVEQALLNTSEITAKPVTPVASKVTPSRLLSILRSRGGRGGILGGIGLTAAALGLGASNRMQPAPEVAAELPPTPEAPPVAPPPATRPADRVRSAVGNLWNRAMKRYNLGGRS